MSLFSEVALPLVVAATTEATVVVTSPLEFVLDTRLVVLGDEYKEESGGVIEVEEWCDTVELMDSSSCRFFSYSVCFPCCISSFVKLAASSPNSVIKH